ncbi:MAG TPA: MCE family protein [Mycobacteriales bacterium]|nr:MCE family protein [Mycobacteriales bacterium]HVX69545.1 MCE family protein [Mycobacteriales bacterium]HWA65594.1 MCE family protein [Mycobacteriales bacterium]
MSASARRVRLIAAALGGVLVLAGCGFHSAYSLPLPGGAASGKTYTVSAEFKDVQDLTPQAAVRVNDVAVGDVSDISLDPKTLEAKVTMRIKQSVVLPANAVATLEQTTLLGEKFVALSAPENVAPEGRLVDGDRVDSASDLPSVEQVFGLLSQFLNGGDLGDLQTISVEVSKALAGREADVRGALSQLTTFVGGLADQKHEIVRAIDGLDRFSSALASQDSTIATALDDLGPGLKVLADERAQFTSLLTHLSRFGKYASRVINASSSQTIAELRDLQPVLRHLAAAGANLPRSLEVLITYPFPRDVGAAAPGDYVNADISIDLGPVLCAVFAGKTPAQLESSLGPVEAELVKLLSGKSCPAVTSSSNAVGQSDLAQLLLSGLGGSQ